MLSHPDTKAAFLFHSKIGLLSEFSSDNGNPSVDFGKEEVEKADVEKAFVNCGVSAGIFVCVQKERLSIDYSAFSENFKSDIISELSLVFCKVENRFGGLFCVDELSVRNEANDQSV